MEERYKYLKKCYLVFGKENTHDFFDLNPELLSSLPNLLVARFKYFKEIIRNLIDEYNDEDLVIYISFTLSGGVKELPSYGDNVVSIIAGDEYYRIPQYINRVKAIFKTQGFGLLYPLQGFSKKPKLSHLNLMMILQILKIIKFSISSWVNFNLIKIKKIIIGGKNKKTIFDLPLGYGDQKEINIKNFRERQNFVFFSGSLNNKKQATKSSLRIINSALKSHKEISRKQMLVSLQDISSRHPDWPIDLSALGTYHQVSNLTNIDGYSERLMDSKICLVPRGITLDTCRFFEALRYGCIIITDCLPNTWFYENAPVFKLESWEELEKTLEMLSLDEQLMADFHDKTLKFWHAKCSTEAVSNFIIKTLRSL